MHRALRSRAAVLVAREMAEMDYQWYEPFHMDATETAETFGLTATDLDSAIRAEVGAIPTGPDRPRLSVRDPQDLGGLNGWEVVFEQCRGMAAGRHMKFTRMLSW